MGLFATWRHTKRLRELEDTVAQLQRQVTGIEMEWNEVLEDLRLRLAKISKRAKKVEALEEAELAEVSPENGAQPAEGLTDNQARAQREILARRRALTTR